MSATTIFSTAAKTLFSEATSLEHYNKSAKELKVLAKIHNISDAGEPRDIVARLMKKDGETGTWPGMYATKTDVVDKKGDGQGEGVAPVKRVRTKDETLSETKVAAKGKGKSNNASLAIVSKNNTATTSMASITATGSKNNGAAIPMSQLAKE